MLQALLALALVISFLPLFVRKIEERNKNRENVAITMQLANVFDAARAFIYENLDGFPDGTKVLSEDELVDTLEPYGLPLGFIPRTPYGGRISLVISKNKTQILSVITASANKMDPMRRAEILSRIGFWGAMIQEDGTLAGATGGWTMTEIPNGVEFGQSDILVRVPEDGEFSELVQRKAKDPAKNVFHTDLLMDKNNIAGAMSVTAGTGRVKNAAASEFLLAGVEADRKNKNEIGSLRAGKAWFSSPDGNPLTIVRSDLATGIFSAASIANYGDAPALTADSVAVRDFNMTAGRTGFAGPGKWDVKAGADFVNVTLSVERLTLGSFLDATRGQDVFLDSENPDMVEYASGSGVRANRIAADNIILRNQISSALLSGGTGEALLEIRPAGTTALPDASLSGINNDSLKIPASAEDNDGNLETCKSVMASIGGRYVSDSIASSIICQFVMYNRIEQRIEIKKCLKGGGGAECF